MRPAKKQSAPTSRNTFRKHNIMSKIKIPDGFQIPEEIEEGQTFEELTTYRLEGDSLVPTMIAGVEIEAEEAEDEMEAEDMEEEATAEMEEAPMRGLGARVMGMA